MSPARIQRRRTKGWRMPTGAVYVGRPSRWGNDVRPGECRNCWWGHEDDVPHEPATAADCADQYRIVQGTTFEILNDPPIRELRGHDLVCWCPLDQPCHADILLELANA